ncbi:molybdopterin cofactor-binding domain-containing protein [Phycicoccus sp.]|uniref:molybdopterin cofactor-binding domain-containing protein n=1 Tax=Phycicoccus sp. TaxID=1902410 RepID=UPI00338D7A8C
MKWTEDRREHFISSAHERAQTRGDRRVRRRRRGPRAGRQGLARQRRLHPLRHHRPDHHLDRLLGPYKPGAYRCEFWSLYTNTVIVTPYRGAGRPRGCSRWSARWMRSRRTSARTAPTCAGRLHPPRGDALRPRADVPGRAAPEV